MGREDFVGVIIEESLEDKKVLDKVKILKTKVEKFPEIKKKYFWGSGFWNPAYFLDNIGREREQTAEYIKK